MRRIPPRSPRSSSHRRTAAVVVLALLAALVGVVTGSGTAAAAPSSTLAVGQQLGPGQSLVSSAGLYRLVVQNDGNLVLYTTAGYPVWNSGTWGRGASTLVLQGDGNLVLYGPGGVPTWYSSTRSTGTDRLILQDDGNLVLYSPTRYTWCTCSMPFTRVVGTPSQLGAGSGLLPGDSLRAGDTTLIMQTDGNLVLYGPAGAVWWSGTFGSGMRATLQTDGNLVVYGMDNRPRWNSQTWGGAGRTLRVGSGGSLQLLNAAGAVLWGAGAGSAPTGIAADVFALLNRQRAANGLPALTSDPRLAAAAATHNAAMSAADTLAHQLPGEADPGARMSAAGYTWRTWAENIAWTSNTTSAGAQSMQTAMYNETPPNDGHRRNILSTAVTQVGVAVLVDSRGKLWLTTDFGTPR